MAESADALSVDEWSILSEKQKEHGEVWWLKTKTAFVVLRCPKPAELRRMKSIITDDKKDASIKADVDVGLARDVVVYPPKEEFLKLLERRPGIASKIAAAAVEAASDMETTEAKKYEPG